MDPKKTTRLLGPGLMVLIFAVALSVLRHELRHYTYHDIVRHLGAIPLGYLVLAFVLTVFNFIVLTGYDTLAARFIRHPLPFRKTAFGSFISYAFSQGLGFPLVTGGTIRYRLYSGWGLSAFEIANIVGFNALTFWMGYLVLAGISFVLEPTAIPSLIHLPFNTLLPLGIIMLAAVLAYFLLGVFRRAPFKILKREIHAPTPQYFFAQLVISSVDWAIASSVIYVLLPHPNPLPYPAFLGVFLLAQIAGIFSHIPGGLGVFEAIIVAMLSSRIPAGQIIGSLVAYRAVYYLIPLIVASVFLAGYELTQTSAVFGRTAKFFGRWSSSLVPQLISYSVFLAGAILLFSGATPAESRRPEWLQDFMPLPVIEVSHFLGSITGVLLLLLARGIQRRVDASYFISVILITAGIVFSLLKGFDYEEAVILGIMLALLLPSRRVFYRKTSLLSRSFTPGWISAIVIAVLCSVWLGLFSYKHVAYSHDLWWHFSFLGDAPRFLRASVGVIATGLFFALAVLLRPATAEPSLPKSADLEKALSVIQRSKQTYPNLAMLGDKELLFSDSGNSFIMFGIGGRSWVSMGDPVGAPDEWPELAWRFRELADRHGGRVIFYEIGQDNTQLYLDLGLTFLKIGEEARVRLEDFSLEGSERKGLRHPHNKVQRDGVNFEVVSGPDIEPLIPELKSVSEAWLAEKQTREKGFSLGFFKPEYLEYFPLGIARKQGRIIAFVNLLMSAEKEEFSIDLMRYLPQSSEPVMDYLFVELMLYAKKEQYKWFNLGMAPFSGLEYAAASPVWSRIGSLVFQHGENFYNFQGLRQYKQKFNPVWTPKFIASPGGLKLPAVLADLAILTSRGLKGVLSK